MSPTVIEAAAWAAVFVLFLIGYLRLRGWIQAVMERRAARGPHEPGPGP